MPTKRAYRLIFATLRARGISAPSSTDQPFRGGTFPPRAIGRLAVPTASFLLPPSLSVAAPRSRAHPSTEGCRSGLRRRDGRTNSVDPRSRGQFGTHGHVAERTSGAQPSARSCSWTGSFGAGLDESDFVGKDDGLDAVSQL